MGYLVLITIIFLPFLLIGFFFRNKNGIPTNWPLVGMIPGFLVNMHRFYEFYVEFLQKSNMTFHYKALWFTNMHFLITVDPANLHHILSKRFENYEKGLRYKEVFEFLGDGILNTDSTAWKYHKNVALSFFNHPNFLNTLVHVTWEKARSGLIPLLDHACENEIEIDLQEVLSRFMYDTMCTIMMSYDPRSLSIDLPHFPILKAMADLEEVMFFRYVMPTFIWKSMRWLNIGEEKKQKQAMKILDDFIYMCINRKREENKKKGSSSSSKQDKNMLRVDLLTLFMADKDNNSDKFLRDTIANFFIAGGETSSTTLSWYFYLLSKNPQVVGQIRVELEENHMKQMKNDDSNRLIKNFKEISGKLIYLHASVFEALRLYPSVTFNQKKAIRRDILPSGHEVSPGTHIMFNMHAMGRMKSIWGEDCNEFKLERWIDEGGKLKHVPSSKFSAFGEGPRSCLGKRVALTHMKIVAAIITQYYDIQPTKEHHHAPLSMIFKMKGGFKVKVHRSQ